MFAGFFVFGDYYDWKKLQLTYHKCIKDLLRLDIFNNIPSFNPAIGSTIFFLKV